MQIFALRSPWGRGQSCCSPRCLTHPSWFCISLSWCACDPKPKPSSACQDPSPSAQGLSQGVKLAQLT